MHAMTLYVLSGHGVARMKQFQHLCSPRQGNGFVVYAPLCNVCKNMMNLCVFIYVHVSALIISSSIVLLNSYSSIEYICQHNDIDV